MTGLGLAAVGAHELVATVGTYTSIRKGIRMFKQGFDVATKVFVIAAVVISAIEAGPAADGATKKQQATEKIQVEIDKALPSWAVPIVNPMIGFLVEAGVAYANQSGFFSHSGASSSTASSVPSLTPLLAV